MRECHRRVFSAVEHVDGPSGSDMKELPHRSWGVPHVLPMMRKEVTDLACPVNVVVVLIMSFCNHVACEVSPSPIRGAFIRCCAWLCTVGASCLAQSMLFDLRCFQVLGGTIVLFSGFTDQEKTLLINELQAFGGSAIADSLLTSAATHVVAKIYTQKVSMILMSMLFSMTSVIEIYSIDQPVLHRIYNAHDSTQPKAPGFMQAHQAQKDDKHVVQLPWSESLHQPSALLVLVL